WQGFSYSNQNSKPGTCGRFGKIANRLKKHSVYRITVQMGEIFPIRALSLQSETQLREKAA
ncbi:hypothetical protein, partial [Pseudomonas edaphica]|uniref:hypothetical protein n=1 Tax=Pseudomonas edaphica TaxID=2006980 RepID=UPI001980B7EB